jgi:3-oxoacyl-[acyl-carrier-protein] synthase-3
MSFRIIGTGRCLPELQVDNQCLAGFLDTSDEWIVSRTGIHTRRVCKSETMTYLSTEAAGKALEKAGISESQLDLILCATLCGDYITPSLACCVAGKLGVTCHAMDINVACTGFISALSLAAAYFESGRAEYILIICAERLSNIADWQDRNTCVLFGDGAGACVLTKGDALKYLHIGTDGDPQPLNMPVPVGNNPFSSAALPEQKYLFMDGQAVFKFATRVMEAEARRAFAALGISSKEVDWCLIHQANRRILDYARQKLGLPAEKLPMNLNRYGNTSSASIPMLLDELLEQEAVRPGQTILLSAFGAGLTYGAALLKWE